MHTLYIYVLYSVRPVGCRVLKMWYVYVGGCVCVIVVEHCPMCVCVFVGCGGAAQYSGKAKCEQF